MEHELGKHESSGPVNIRLRVYEDDERTRCYCEECNGAVQRIIGIGRRYTNGYSEGDSRYREVVDEIRILENEVPWLLDNLDKLKVFLNRSRRP